MSQDGHTGTDILRALIGDWEGTNSTWFEPDKLADASPIWGTIRPLSGSDFLIYEYHSHMESKPFHGIAMIAYHAAVQAFEMAWIDGFHMSGNIMMCKGDGRNDRISVKGSYAVPDYGEWGWRIEFTLIDDDHLTVTSYNITPEGEESKGVEAVYRRKGVMA